MITEMFSLWAFIDLFCANKNTFNVPACILVVSEIKSVFIGTEHQMKLSTEHLK